MSNDENLTAKRRGAPKGARTKAGLIRSGEVKSLRDHILITQGKTPPKKKPGRPKTRLKVNWIEGIEAIKVEHKLKGHGSDLAAIKIFVNANFSPAIRQREIEKIQKLLSKQRNKNPKIPT